MNRYDENNGVTAGGYGGRRIATTNQRTPIRAASERGTKSSAGYRYPAYAVANVNRKARER